MYHIPNDIRAIKSANAIIEGLEKCIEEKPFDAITISDIHNHCYVSRATFYRLFDSIDDVLLYQCECIRQEAIELVMKKGILRTEDLGVFTIKVWLKHKPLIKAIVENRLFGILYEAHMRHPEDFKNLYSFDYTDEAQLSYFVSFVVSILFCSFNIYYREMGNKTIEELIQYTNEMVGKIVQAWGITQGNN